ncbi:hypothetical protein X962_5923 [Burkholderia pseudomallei MSHR7343]|nr:hypothetical protein X948_5667 [Burkholderia pseudomallei MSHR5608]KGS19334.1 hypothetical protein X962_5923 [Burkholderia pseudomallei MSHR7343]
MEKTQPNITLYFIIKYLAVVFANSEPPQNTLIRPLGNKHLQTHFGRHPVAASASSSILARDQTHRRRPPATF